MFLKFVLLVFQDAAQRSRFKRIEGTNRLKDEHDQLRIMFQEAKSELENVDKENEDMRRAIRQKTEERDNYKRARFSVRSRGNE